MDLISGNITSPKGFSATGGFVGLKKAKKDLALIYSKEPCVAAGVFTRNIVKAAPVLLCQEVIEKGGPIYGLIVNSGNANACTGRQGTLDALAMAAYYAQALGLDQSEILVSSTGVIGVPLPMDIVNQGIQKLTPQLGESFTDGEDAAEAIMTTDTFIKTCAIQIEIGGKTVTLGGMAKGSGMIHPNMATMLAFIATDAKISQSLLQKALTETVKDTFNMISVDGDTSTNDTALVLANGCADNPTIDQEDEVYLQFVEALRTISQKLAIDIVRDGEGATKLMEVKVQGAITNEDAVKIAKSVASSNLFKAALFGCDANWGRVLCAMGYSDGVFDPEKVDIVFRSASGEIQLMTQGQPLIFDESLATEILNEKTVYIDIILSEGDKNATAWGCDLTYDYVKINGQYRS